MQAHPIVARPECVGSEPRFGQFAVLDSVELPPQNLDLPAGRFEIEVWKLSLVGYMYQGVTRHGIVFGDHVIHREGIVRESELERFDVLFELVGTVNVTDERIVYNVIVVHQLVDCVQISLSASPQFT